MNRRIKQRAKKSFDLTAASYTPGRLLDTLIELLDVKNDFALSVRLDIEHSVVSKIRRRKDRISEFVIVRMLDASGMTIVELRKLAGMPSELDQVE